ncbi:hypothetical protein OIU84_007495 [Salix udensis]|uniref:Post-GPI attachment to proteins factor 3 n=1 Tax=Salix udensis TaxID=889485 RepID=A0AAD6JTR2_9ROSI|nr:hypothetical protein OIU84_007495 [Salix udensis]
MGFTRVMVMLIRFTKLVWSGVRKLGVWGGNAPNTVNSHLMGSQRVGHGIYKSHCICSGNNGIVVVTVDTTACLPGRKKERNLVASLSSIMGNGCFIVLMVFQEPVSVALSALNLAFQFHGWVSFFILIYYKLPLTPSKKTYYEYTGLWNIYGILSMNSWFWSAVFHSRDVELTEKLHCSSAVALLGFSLILAIQRAFSVRNEASRVMVSTPVIAFVTTHILYLNCYNLDYGLNIKVCVAMGVAQLLIWAVWAGVTHHPSWSKLWVAVVGGGLVMLLEIYDFPPYHGFVDSHALWHATTIPLTYLWWSFAKDDAEFRTSSFLKKAK